MTSGTLMLAGALALAISKPCEYIFGYVLERYVLTDIMSAVDGESAEAEKERNDREVEVHIAHARRICGRCRGGGGEPQRFPKTDPA